MRKAAYVTLLILALLGSTMAGVVAKRKNPPCSSKLGVFYLGRDDGCTVHKLIGTRRLPMFRTTVEKANEFVPYYKKHNPDGLVMVAFGGGIAPEYAGDPKAFALTRWNEYIKPNLELIRPEVVKMIDYFAVSNNLMEPHSVEQAQWWSEYVKELCSICRGAGIRPIVLSSGVGCLPCGNERELKVLEAMIPGLRATLDVGGAWSYQAYTINYTTDVKEESFYSLRYRRAYAFFQKRAPDLMKLPMVLSDCGVDKGGDPNNDGYAARGSMEKFSKWLCWFDKEIRKDPYVPGAALFVIGAGDGWPSFDLGPMVLWLSAYLKNGSSECP